MTAKDLTKFSESIFSVIFFISNFFFWKEGGYFGTESELQPLLHTWSLGVEEQFYIFFPIFLILVWKIKKNFLIPAIIIGALISLFSSQIGGNFKHTNLSLEFPYFKLPFEWFWQAGLANFYLPFGRIWELMIGSLIAFHFQKNEIKENSINNFFSIGGLLLIILSIVFFSEHIQYPSIFTIVPAIGTALIIIFTTKNTYLNKILSNKILVNLGLISFSFYLWHQPILAFTRIYLVENLNLFLSLFLIIVAILTSYFSWKYVEQPFRDKNRISDRKLLIYFILCFFIIFLFANLLFFKKITPTKTILPYKIEQSMKGHEKNNCFDIKFAHLNKIEKWFCEIGKKNKNISFVILGDSHALSFKKVLDVAAIEKNSKGIFVGYSGCLPLLDIYTLRPNQVEHNCKSLNTKIFKYVKNNKIKKVFLVARWTYYTDGNYENTEFSHTSIFDNFSSNKKNSRLAFEYGLKNTIKKYNEIGVKIIFIHQVPLQVFSPDYIYLYSLKKNKSNYIKFIYELSVDYKKHALLQKFVKDKVNIFSKNPLFYQIDPEFIFCDKKKCTVGQHDMSYYSDDDHLSTSGSMKLKDEIKKFLD